VFLGKTIGERVTIVREYREISKTATAAKKRKSWTFIRTAVEAALRQHGVRHLIHGHTHRPAQHVLQLGRAERTGARCWATGTTKAACWCATRMEALVSRGGRTPGATDANNCVLEKLELNPLHPLASVVASYLTDFLGLARFPPLSEWASIH